MARSRSQPSTTRSAVGTTPPAPARRRSGPRRWLTGVARAAVASPIGLGLLGASGALAIRLVGSTWRIRTEGPDPVAPGAPPCIGALWHESLLVGAYVFRDRGIGVTVSRSRDGDLIAAVLTRLGYVPRRGSSSRGGSAALKALVRTVRQGVTVAIQTDGPRGPARRSKVGVVALARLTGAPIAPIVFSAAPALRFRSWDRTLLPPPFARIEGRYGAGLRVQPSVDDDADERVRAALDARLDQLSDALDRDMALRRSGRAA